MNVYCVNASFANDALRPSDHKAIMKIMKFALHMHNKEDISSIYEAVKKMDLPYNQLDLDKVMNNDLPMKRNFIQRMFPDTFSIFGNIIR